MTKLDWDRVSMENLVIRREEEHRRRLAELANEPNPSKQRNQRGRAGLGRRQLLHKCSICGTYRVRFAIAGHIEECQARRARLLLRNASDQQQDFHPPAPPPSPVGRSKRKLKRKKKKVSIWTDVLFPDSSQVLAETISMRLRELGLQVRLIQTTRYMSRAGRTGQVVCNFAGPDFVALTKRIIEQLKDLVILESRYRGLKGTGGTAVTIRI